MKTLMLIGLVLFINTSVSAQSLTWSVPLDFIAYGRYVDELGNITLTGSANTRKYSASGSELWQTDFSGLSLASNSSSGPLYVTGNTSIRRYNHDGTFVWEKIVDPIKSISIDRVNNALLITTANSTMALTKIAPDGTILWSTQFPGGSFMKIRTDANGNWYVLYSTPRDPIHISVINLAKVSANGVVLWKRDWSFELATENNLYTRTWENIDMVVTPTGSAYVGGTLEVIAGSRDKTSWLIECVTPDGKVRRPVSNSGRGKYHNFSYNWLNGILMTQQGQVYAYGTIDQHRPSDGWSENIFTTVYAFKPNSSKFLWKRTLSNIIGNSHVFGTFDGVIDAQGNLNTYIFWGDSAAIRPIAVTPAGEILQHNQDLSDWSTNATRDYDNEGNFFIQIGYELRKYQNFTFVPSNQAPTASHSSIDELSVTKYQLSQNYPNPFNPTTTISFDLVGDALVSVKVYNTLGQEVAILADKEEFGEGTNELEFEASSLPSGVYYYKIIAEGLDGEGVRFTSVKKMVLVR